MHLFLSNQENCMCITENIPEAVGQQFIVLFKMNTITLSDLVKVHIKQKVIIFFIRFINKCPWSCCARFISAGYSKEKKFQNAITCSASLLDLSQHLFLIFLFIWTRNVAYLHDNYMPSKEDFRMCVVHLEKATRIMPPELLSV